ncbi:MAG: 2Fe-2S iron-sulfur cluster-binding protein [Ignisphaera sp.]|nr:2Fe-2S iron-sulfur cluster-binding protein [Ignisphaera sp.]MDW8085381.1 2Fe-2S iron-sulfur cluster-binding protein [Ignisphaera sp.]
MVKVHVNGVEVDVPPGSYIIDAVEEAGFKVPLLCYLQGVFSEATCRICVVKLNGRVVPACRYPVQEGASIVTHDEELISLRRLNLELLLAIHTISCWNCSVKGSCTLVSLAKEMLIEGIPVCSECPLYGELCLLSYRIPCLGPLTIAGCNAECTKLGAPCTGCRGFILSKGVWREALKHYKMRNVDVESLLSAIRVFWNNLPEDLSKLIKEVSPSNGQQPEV